MNKILKAFLYVFGWLAVFALTIVPNIGVVLGYLCGALGVIGVGAFIRAWWLDSIDSVRH